MIRNYINARKKEFKAKYTPFIPSRANGKSRLAVYKTIQMISEYNRLNSNRYYRYIRKGIRRDMATSLNLPSQKFKIEYDCKWISNK
jgi:hypothetical protein